MAVATLPTTRVALLTQLRQDPSDQAGWDEFVERYGRHIYRWCRQWKLQDADAEDVTQDILVKLTQKLRAFAYDPSRQFPRLAQDGRSPCLEGFRRQPPPRPARRGLQPGTGVNANH